MENIPVLNLHFSLLLPMSSQITARELFADCYYGQDLCHVPAFQYL